MIFVSILPMESNIKAKILKVVGLIHIKNKKLLVAKSEKYDKYYLPGGKIEVNESPLEALSREIKEELGTELLETSIKAFNLIKADAYGQGDGVKVEMHCYQADLKGEPKPQAEIESLDWLEDSRK